MNDQLAGPPAAEPDRAGGTKIGVTHRAVLAGVTVLGGALSFGVCTAYALLAILLQVATKDRLEGRSDRTALPEWISVVMVPFVGALSAGGITWVFEFQGGRRWFFAALLLVATFGVCVALGRALSAYSDTGQIASERGGLWIFDRKAESDASWRQATITRLEDDLGLHVLPARAGVATRPTIEGTKTRDNSSRPWLPTAAQRARSVVQGPTRRLREQARATGSALVRQWEVWLAVVTAVSILTVAGWVSSLSPGLIAWAVLGAASYVPATWASYSVAYSDGRAVWARLEYLRRVADQELDQGRPKPSVGPGLRRSRAVPSR